MHTDRGLPSRDARREPSARRSRGGRVAIVTAAVIAVVAIAVAITVTQAVPR